MASGTVVPDACRTTQLPSALEALLHEREVLDGHHVAVADDHVGVAARAIGRDEGGDVVGGVLVVGVGVDDHVGAELEAGVEAGLEGVGEALVVGELHDVVDAELPGDLDRAVGGAVVDDQPLDDVEPSTSRGRAPSEIGSWSSSLRQGIWMMSFTQKSLVSRSSMVT